MAKKDKASKPEEDLKGQSDEVKDTTGDALPPDNAATTDTAPNTDAKADDGEEKPDDIGDADKKGAIKIEPVAFEIKLKAHHPLESYGRCGYRFNKTESVEIAKNALSDSQIIALAEDPWLEFVPVCEE